MAIQIRRGTDAEWESNNSNIIAGEPAVTLDTGRFFVGTGNGEFVELQKKVEGDALTEDVKQALLQIAEKVAYIDEHGQTYYNDLESALYPPSPLASISAVYTQGGTVYDTDSLDSLKSDLVVTAIYEDSSQAVVTTYTLSGTLTAGTSTITVSYGGKTTTFNVTVTHQAGTVTITNTLNGCTNSNSATYATEGDSYSATITASTGYSLTGATVSVTMGNVDITSTAYNNGVISIASLTGNLSITITAVLVELVSISAVYTQGGTVYDTDSLDSLKDDLVVTATYSDSSTATIPSTDYTLSGTLTAGTSTITVAYGGKTTTFNVTVTEAPTTLYELASTFSSTGSEYIDTGVKYPTSGTITIAIEFTITTFQSSANNGIDYVYGNRTSATASYLALQDQIVSGTNKYVWGVGIGYNAGKNIVSANDLVRMVSIFTLSNDGKNASVSTSFKNVTKNTTNTYSNTYTANAGQSYNDTDIFLGNPYNDMGFIGSISKFIIDSATWDSTQINAFLAGE